MNNIKDLKTIFLEQLNNQLNLQKEDLSAVSFELNVQEDKQAFGDISSNAALVLSKKLKANPRAIAEQIASSLKHPLIERIEIAGPGFLNFFLANDAFVELATMLFDQPTDFFTLDNDACKNRYSLEFVSANPTGPLHLGHGRGGIIGDVLGNILTFVGHDVTKEYYINDAGAQIQKLGQSFKVRCQQAVGVQVEVPEDGYRGDYLVELAKECTDQYGKDILNMDDQFFADYAKNKLLERIKTTLHDYGIDFDLWFSEKTLHDDGAVAQALQVLIDRGTTYEKDDALWFTSTQYGDDKDRVLRKQNGELTYIAADVAYTENKFERADQLILVLGQDHHSYVTRLKGIAAALGHDPNNLDVILYQLITLKEGGEQLRMSKRAGTMVTLKEIIELVGTDVARFFFLNRKADGHLDFDLDLALKKTDENPVYYIQYAYVRTKSILQKAQEHNQLANITATDAQYLNKEEQLLIKKIVSLQELLQSISNNYQTHLLTYYVLELAHLFHSYYSKNRVIDVANTPQSRARLLLITMLKNTFELALDLLGLSKPEKM